MVPTTIDKTIDISYGKYYDATPTSLCILLNWYFSDTVAETLLLKHDYRPVDISHHFLPQLLTYSGDR